MKAPPASDFYLSPKPFPKLNRKNWIPAFAGMTIIGEYCPMPLQIASVAALLRNDR